jgi:dihydroneopterin aldolase
VDGVDHRLIERIAVRGIRAYGKHGAAPRERDYVQPFDIDVELEVDAAAARASDDLRDAVDYAAVAKSVETLVRERSYVLLERLADEIARALLAEERIRSVRLVIAKPALLDGATPSVTVCAARSGP